MDESSALSRKSLLLPSGVKVSPMGDIFVKNQVSVMKNSIRCVIVNYGTINHIRKAKNEKYR